MRAFTDTHIFNRLKAVTEFKETGNKLIVGVQSAADATDKFDDKFFLYDRDFRFLAACTGTTNSGLYGLMNFAKWDRRGTGIWKTDMWYEAAYRRGLHNGRMPCLRLQVPVWHYRDNNKNGLCEQAGELYYENTSANFHGVSYRMASNKVLDSIGHWGVMCNVINNMSQYRNILALCGADDVDYALLKEW